MEPNTVFDAFVISAFIMGFLIFGVVVHLLVGIMIRGAGRAFPRRRKQVTAPSAPPSISVRRDLAPRRATVRLREMNYAAITSQHPRRG